jgi:putative membrane protein
VDVSKAVAGRLGNSECSSLAQMMVADHTAANAELQELAAKKGVTLPEDKPEYGEKWAKKTSDLDEDYLKEMKSDHEDAIELFEKASKSDDPDIAAFATKTLPTLRHHLSMVVDAKKMVK